MMRSALALALVALAARGSAASDAAASDCAKAYRDQTPWPRNTPATKKCEEFTKFARCMASVPTSDPNLASANQALETAEQDAPGCEIKFQPSITTVQRKMRVVSDDEVEFQRFRRETVGVFQLKKDQDALSGAVKLAAADGTKNAKAAAANAKGLADLASTQKELEAALKEVHTFVNTTVATLIQTTKQTAAEAQTKGQDPLQQSKTYWLATSAAVLATNEPAAAMQVVGLGLDAYYNPLFPPFFKCVFKDVATKKTIATPGKVIAGSDPVFKSLITYHVGCDSPKYVEEKTTFSLSLTYEDASGARTIPFQGVKGSDGLLFDMVWTEANFVGTDVVVDVKGLDAEKSHQCVYTDEANAKIKKITDAKFLPDNKYKLSCGKQPTGFTIKLTTSRVKLAIFVKGTSTQATYAGSGSTLLQLPTCKNGVKDGAESDVDCGGLCPACGPQKKCAKDADCFNGQCNKNKCGDGPGTQSDPGQSCKQIKRDYPTKGNGWYFVKGTKDQFKNDPFKVYCWQKDRLGGGWTLGIVNWYGPRFGNHNGKYDGNSQSCNVLGRMPCGGYKLNDDKIRAIIGQSRHNRHTTSGTATKFDVMADQNGYQYRYSYRNSEYTVQLGYNAFWHWTQWRAVSTSKTPVTFQSWGWMNQNYDGGSTGLGNGELVWEGELNCDTSGSRAGIRCYKVKRGGKFGNKPNGGTGCGKNLNQGRWTGNAHWYMSDGNSDTYIYFCNGAQHSSSASMNHRWWFRSHKDADA